MSEFNHFAKELDAAFRTARSEYAAVYDELTKAKENASAAGLDAVKKQIATLQLQEAENKMRTETERIWAAFDAKAAELRSALEKEVQISNLADPSAIDSNAVELMKTGILTVDDYFGFADRYDGNPTMLKLIGHYAKEAADSADDRKDKVALTVLAQDLESVGQYDDRRQLLQRARRQRQQAHYSRRCCKHGRMVGSAFRRNY